MRGDPYRSEQGEGHEPGDEEEQVEWEAQSQRIDREAGQYGEGGGDARDDQGVHDTAVGGGLVDGDLVGEAGEDGHDDDGADELGEAEEAVGDPVGDALFLSVTVVRHGCGVADRTSLASWLDCDIAA